jgi:L-ribulokinase
MQIYADVLGEEIKLAESENSVALGAAILGCLAAGVESTGHASMEAAIRAMARQRSEPVYRPRAEAQSQYDKLYALYRGAGEFDGVLARTMRALRGFATS